MNDRYPKRDKTIRQRHWQRALWVCASLSVATLAWGQAQQHIQVPGPDEGYTITRNGESNVRAPEGFEGYTDTSTQTAIGNSPYTTGKKYVTHFVMSNQIAVCPGADGIVEGQGEFSVSFEYSDAQANTTSHLQTEMHARAKLRAKVGDDAMIDNPVYAEIDYHFTQTGSMRDRGGAIVNSPPVDDAQHVSISFAVQPGLMEAPKFEDFSGGDPTKGHLDQAFAAGTALTYWSGIYYAFAETEWRQPGKCVTVVFNPPSNSRQPVLGGDTKVKAEVKTKGGEVTRGTYEAKTEVDAGSVSPGGGTSNLGSPLEFTYTAPNKKVKKAGFKVTVVSRAGVGAGDWDTGLGTGWSGQITCSRVTSGDEGHNDLQTWSNYEATNITIDVKDGVGKVSAFSEQKNLRINKQNALRGGKIILIDDNSDDSQGSDEGNGDAKVTVFIDKPTNTYTISPEFRPFEPGHLHTVSCIKTNCKTLDQPYYVQSIIPGLSGKVDDPNHLHGTQSSVTENLGRAKNGKQTFTLTWDLARQGTTK